MKLLTGGRFFDKISVIFICRASLYLKFHGKKYYKTCISYHIEPDRSLFEDR